LETVFWIFLPEPDQLTKSMDILDFILFPLYVVLLYLFFKNRKKKLGDPQLEQYFIQGFWVRVVGCMAFTVFNTYISQGDSIGVYQPEGVHIYRLILNDANNIKLLATPASSYDLTLLFDNFNEGTLVTESNFLTVRIVALFSFLSFGSYFVNNFLFAMVAYAGMWRLFKFFYQEKPHLHKYFAVAILYFPTMVFWSSGTMKDALCIGGLGFITYSLYNLVYKKQGLLINTFTILVFGYMLLVLKVYILIAYLPFLVLFLVLKNVTLLKNRFFRYFLAPLLIAGCIFGFSRVLDSFDEELGNYAVSNITEAVKTQQFNFQAQAESGSNFSLGAEFDGSISGLITLAPAAVVATLFRPFLWESKKLSTLLSSMESLALVFLTLYVLFKAGLGTFFRSLFRNPLVVYCFTFSMMFAIFVGATTLNFGSLVRYKIPCLPFYLITLFLILDIARSKQVNPPKIPLSGEGHL
jgi:hypothetical protein